MPWCVQSDTVCAGVFRAPAIKTDGDSTRPDCLPDGARLQLDPAIDVSKIAGHHSSGAHGGPGPAALRRLRDRPRRRPT